MKTQSFSYPLPRELIARYPLRRGTGRLLVVDRRENRLSHRQFPDIVDYLAEGDVLVLNDTRVIPARLLGRKPTGGLVEVLLLKELAPGTWRCLASASKKMRPGSVVTFEHGLRACVAGRDADAWILTFSEPDRVLGVGAVPLPSYLCRDAEESDSRDYQTVFARHDGSVAAPTAGLHFTPEVLRQCADSGVEIVFLTLHVGPGTFLPVRTERVEDHVMHAEEFALSEQAADTITRAMGESRRIVAVGTTTTRVLEHLMHAQGRVVAGKGSTDIFIRNGFSFQAVGALLTNFHLPCSTLLMLVCAFGGHGLVMRAYQEAVELGYRFFSYGDAMLII